MRSGELTLQTSALETLYFGQFTLASLLWPMGYFRITFSLFFITRPGACMKMNLICMWMKTYNPMKGCGPGLALKIKGYLHKLIILLYPQPTQHHTKFLKKLTLWGLELLSYRGTNDLRPSKMSYVLRKWVLLNLGPRPQRPTSSRPVAITG